MGPYLSGCSNGIYACQLSTDTNPKILRATICRPGCHCLLAQAGACTVVPKVKRKILLNRRAAPT